MRYILLLIIPIIFSCQMENGSEKSDADDTATQAEIIEDSDERTDSIIHLTFSAGEQLVTKIEKNYQRIHVDVPVVKTDSLVGSLMLPGNKRNVYISHIILPDNQTDGPFGNEIHYATEYKGTYTLIIGPNTRAEGTPVGDVTIKIDLK